jgi:hypothetical protein
LSCDGIDKLISLFLDGRLNESQQQKLKDHLSSCRSCREKLSFLQSVEQKVKGVKAHEPPDEYWKTFSVRVREKIMARQEKPALGLRGIIESVFSFSPLKIKIAAGVVSVLFVFVVGRLYLEYRGEHIAPPQESAQMRQEPKSDHVQEELGNKPSPPGESGKQAAPVVVAKPGTAKEPASESRKETLPSQVAEAEKYASQKGGKTPSPPLVSDEEAPSTAVPSVQIPAPVKAEAEERDLVSESKSAGAGVDQRTQKKKTEIISVPETGTLKGGDSTQENRLKEILSTQVGFVSPQTSSRVVFHPLEGGPPIAKIGEADTAVEADTLKRVIEVWRAYVKEHPTDSLSKEGYLQIATAYYLLARASQDTSVVSEGSGVIEQYIDQVQDSTVKGGLNRRLKQIQALRQK